MIISREFQGFTFGKLWKEIEQVNQPISFDVSWLDMPVKKQIINPHRFIMQSKDKRDGLRILFKQIDEGYPKDEQGRGLSYRDITSKQLDNHHLWIYSTFANSGYIWKE